MVEVNKADETSELTLRLLVRNFTNSFDFVGDWRDTVLVDVVSKEIEGGHAEEAFAWIDDDSVRSEAVEHGSQIIKVLFADWVLQRTWSMNR